MVKEKPAVDHAARIRNAASVQALARCVCAYGNYVAQKLFEAGRSDEALEVVFGYEAMAQLVEKCDTLDQAFTCIASDDFAL